MKSTPTLFDPAPTRREPRFKRVGFLAALLVALGLLAAACSGGPSGSGVAQTKSTTSTTSSSSATGSQTKSLEAFAACMRSHGEPNFPDPSSGGQLNPGNGVDPSSPQYQSANSACKSLQPTGGGGNSTTGGGTTQSPQQEAQLLKYAQCMRSHGVPGFPDPTSKGISLGDGVDPQSPQFQSAQKACQSLAPSLSSGGKTTGGPGAGS
jgi:hypothetical protein